MNNLYVFDTNVLVSALLFANSSPREAFELALNTGRILISKETVDELNNVLSRPKFKRYISPEKRERFLLSLVQKSILIEIKEKIEECRDPKDNKFLELAINGKATAIVSGDKDLLILHPFRGIPIITVSQFLNS
ncbi:MAG: putative toxin-antitoxin system toxin component, PIN family [Xenococcaceae cyanobacterium MO_188.B32]|nr:putative toxin-antitoxin system toxin component, PIN family [Xenococcaceae cyanobacterium MO_188.B32]